MPDSLITLHEASTLLGISAGTLRNWDRSGKLKAIRHPINGYRTYRLEEVLQLLRSTSLFPADVTLLAQVRESSTKPLTASDLRRLVTSLHRILRDTDGGSSLIERFDELTKVLYCKTHEERSSRNGRSPNVFSQSEASDEEVARGVRTLYGNLVQQKPELFPKRFREIALSDAGLAQITRALASVSLALHSHDLKGLAYEELIKGTFEKGENQQFFTPTLIVDFMVELLEAHLGGTVADPACGTGGFLLRTARSRYVTSTTTILGIEIDERLAWATRMNLDMHGVENFSVLHQPGAGTLGREILDRAESIDTIITNPPFGSDLSDPDALGCFELGQGRASRRRGVLFIERCLKLVRPGGVVAIIIDDGVLNAPSNTDTRALLLRLAIPIAVISLPDTAFMPYATVKSSILILRKRGTETFEECTFFAEAEEVGRKSNGDPLMIPNPVTRKLELQSDLPAILSYWRAGMHQAIPPHERVRAFWSRVDVRDPSFIGEGSRLDAAFHHPSRHEAAAALAKSKYPLHALGTICNVRNEAVIPSKELQEEQISYIGLANIEPQTGAYTPSLVEGESLKSAVKRFQAGDVLFAKMRPELRKICAVAEDAESGYTSAECLVLSPKRTDTGSPMILPELLSHMLRSELAYGQIVHLVMGIGRPRLNRGAVLNIRLPIPPLTEQEHLLEQFRASEAAAAKLLEQSARARTDSRVLLDDAKRTLVDRLIQK